MATLRTSICLPLLLASAVLAGCASAPAPQPTVKTSPTPQTTRHSDQARVQSGPRVDRQAQHCMALAMYWEARGEGARGMQAEGSVILNRVADHRFPNTACGVVRQGGETPPCQFSWWCDGKSDRPTNHGQWSAALAVAKDMLIAPHYDATGGALFFHSTSIRRPWQRQRTAQIGNHVFYR